MQLDTIDTSEHPSDWYIFEPRFLARSIGLARQYLDKNMPDEVPTTTDKEFDRLLQLQPTFHKNIIRKSKCSRVSK
jgi:hypothetical protein